jgi:HlyD family secretion protein
MHYQRVATAVLSAGLALAGCGGGGGDHGPAPLNVDVAPAQRRDIATFVTLDGQVAPLEDSTLSFQQQGPIATVYVNVGDRVSAGQILARIDPSVLNAQLAQAEASASQAAATARGAQIGLPISRTSNIATLATAKAALDNARLVYQQNQQLYSQGYVSQQALEQARSQYVLAQSQYSTASTGQESTNVTAQNVKASMAQAAAAAAQASVLRTQLGQTALYAPFDGVVTARLADPGAMAGPSVPVLRVSRVSTVWVNVNVPDEDLAYVHPGSMVTFRSSSLTGKSFVGRVDTVNAVPTQGTLSYLARFRQPNPGAILRGGMLVTVTIQKEKHMGTIVVPRSAVAQSEKGSSVFIVNGNKAQEVPVKIGLQTDTLAEVSSPRVTAGTQVITTRPDALQDGSVVAVNGGSSASPAGRSAQ